MFCSSVFFYVYLVAFVLGFSFQSRRVWSCSDTLFLVIFLLLHLQQKQLQQSISCQCSLSISENHKKQLPEVFINKSCSFFVARLGFIDTTWITISVLLLIFPEGCRTRFDMYLSYIFYKISYSRNKAVKIIIKQILL